MPSEATTPPVFESEVHDLHVDGADHDHEFTDWEQDSGAEEYENGVTGWIRFESRCVTCPARVGRVITLHHSTS